MERSKTPILDGGVLGLGSTALSFVIPDLAPAEDRRLRHGCFEGSGRASRALLAASLRAGIGFQSWHDQRRHP
jgi:hypothetical protein